MFHYLTTGRLRILACDPEILEQALAGDSALAAYLKVSVPENWTEFGPLALQYSLDRLRSGEHEKNWWTYFPIHTEDNALIGSCGYKGPPNEAGEVEIGYEIAAPYRNRGLATELAKALVDHAFGIAGITTVQAHTLGEVNASTKVLNKCGFQKTGELHDEENGTLWKWEIKRDSALRQEPI